MRTDDVSVTRQSLPAIHRGLSQRRGIALALGAALLLGGCDTLSSLNPFDKPEVYKPDLTPPTPAAEACAIERTARLWRPNRTMRAKRYVKVVATE